jgi:pre-mRNA-splicing factor SPF27
LIRNYQLESQAKEVEAEVEVWKEKVVEVNRKRRVFQVSFVMRLWSVADETECGVVWRGVKWWQSRLHDTDDTPTPHTYLYTPRQESTGKHLSSLENRWQDLITGTIQLEMASRAMELEVEVLKGQEARLERDLEGRV